MALEPNCSACEDLRQTSADFTVNGLSEQMCASLGNNTGLSTSDNNDTCEDLNNLNDCLVGNMTKEVAAYPICDWKKFMKNFIPNLWTTLKAIICAFCGIWAAIKNLYCLIDFLFNGASFSFSETTTGTSSELRAGTGVDFSLRSTSAQHTSDVSIMYVAGGFGRMSGSLRCFAESFVDANGNTQSGNSVWNLNSQLPSGGERLLEIRIKKSEYPQIKRIFQGWGFPVNGHDRFYQVITEVFDGDSESQKCTNQNSENYGYVMAYGQHGWCNKCGEPSESGYSSGHRVPSGWIYFQLRLAYRGTLTSYQVDDKNGQKTGFDITPIAQFGMRMNRGAVDCDD